jgi:5-methylcytosine-specific restriction enzyme subunit McrC
VKRQVQELSLVEYEPRRLTRAELDVSTAEAIWRHYGHQVAVEFPSVKTGDHWQLISQGWIGVLPVSPQLTLVLQPKIALATLWSMLAYSFDLVDWLTGKALVGVAGLFDLYDQLAHQLAQGVLVRCRQGLYQEYVSKVARVPAVRGRIELEPTIRTLWQPAPVCRFEEQTPDVAENQILLWTLTCLLQSPICREGREALVRRAVQTLSNVVTLRPVAIAELRQRHYTRLNADYNLLHSLCYFFMAQVMPATKTGDLTMLPFCLRMATLYERFVAAWLARHLDNRWRLKIQEHYRFGREYEHRFAIDLVVRQRGSEQARCVIDTKYRAPSAAPAAEEIAQVVAYAEATGAPEAILVYPTVLARPLDARVGRIRVRTVTFALDQPIDQAGAAFMQALCL